VLSIADLPPDRPVNINHHHPPQPQPHSDAIAETRPLKDVEREMILKALKDAGGSRVRAAESLGISQKTLYNKLKRYQLQRDSEE
jgi:DNA-binding NtrC family response regulator